MTFTSFQIGFTILDATKDIHNLWEEVKTSISARVWMLIATFMNSYEGFKISVTADGVEIARELKFEVELERCD